MLEQLKMVAQMMLEIEFGASLKVVLPMVLIRAMRPRMGLWLILEPTSKPFIQWLSIRFCLSGVRMPR